MIGEFTSENAAMAIQGVGEMYEAIPKSKRGNFLGHLNEISLFLEKAQRVAKEKEEKENEIPDLDTK